MVLQVLGGKLIKNASLSTRWLFQWHDKQSHKQLTEKNHMLRIDVSVFSQKTWNIRPTGQTEPYPTALEAVSAAKSKQQGNKQHRRTFRVGTDFPPYWDLHQQPASVIPALAQRQLQDESQLCQQKDSWGLTANWCHLQQSSAFPNGSWLIKRPSSESSSCNYRCTEHF